MNPKIPHKLGFRKIGAFSLIPKIPKCVVWDFHFCFLPSSWLPEKENVLPFLLPPPLLALILPLLGHCLSPHWKTVPEQHLEGGGSEGVDLAVVSVVATLGAHFTAGLSETCLQKYNQQNKTKSKTKFLFICFFFLFSETFIYLQ